MGKLFNHCSNLPTAQTALRKIFGQRDDVQKLDWFVRHEHSSLLHVTTRQTGKIFTRSPLGSLIGYHHDRCTKICKKADSNVGPGHCPAISTAIKPFWKCSRFSACGKTSDRGPSITALLISSPR